MSIDSPPLTKRYGRQTSAHPIPEGETGVPFVVDSGPSVSGTFYVVGGILMVLAIALLDYITGPHVSLSIFYLIPVAVCAWWGGSPHGILLALVGSVAWHVIDRVETPATPLVAELWNGVVRFGTLVLVSSLASRLHASIARERQLARTDALTGAANARTFYETAALESERLRRNSRPLTMAYLDLDNFKKLNDRLGHAAGDEVLTHLVKTVRPHLRVNDLLARLGGDEFALLLPEQGAEGAMAVLTRLQELLADEMSRKGWEVTASIGAITFLRPEWDVDVMVQRVDALMYDAKRSRRGRIEHAIVGEGAEAFEVLKGVEKRASARVLNCRIVRVYGEGEVGNQDEIATVRDISIEGVGLYMETEFPPNTLLVVEALSQPSRTLLARVVRVEAERSGWVHGCALPTPLNEEELSAWLGTATVREGSTALPPVAPSTVCEQDIASVTTVEF